MKKILFTMIVIMLAGALWAAGGFFNEGGEKRASATGVALDRTSLTLTVGQSYTLTATVKPSGASDKRVTWLSYDESIATVDSAGKVKGVAPGSTTVRVKTKDGGFTAKCKVKVVVPVTGVAVSPASVSVVKGKTASLTATVSPADATDKSVTWVSYDESIATVDSAGKVKGVAAGSTTVRAKTKDGGFTAKCKVKVKDPVVPVTGVSLDKTKVSVKKGASVTLKATVSPSGATNKSVSWLSYDESIATVDSAGKVKGVAPGSTTVRVKTKDGGFTAKCKVKVVVPVTGVALDKTSATVGLGSELTLKATVSPSNATNKSVSWLSYDESVATVDSAGKVKGVAEGATTIRVKTKDGGFTAKCKVTVKKIAVTGVSVSPSTLALEAGDTAALTATVKPAAAYDKSVTWSSGNKAVAKVSSKGVVTAVAEGTAIITASTADGGFTAACEVTVSKSSQGLSKISPTGSSLDPMGQVIKVKVKLSSANSGKAVTYKWTVNGGSADGIIVDAADPVEDPATGKERVYTKRVKIAGERREIVLKAYVGSSLIGTLSWVQERAAPPSIE